VRPAARTMRDWRLISRSSRAVRTTTRDGYAEHGLAGLADLPRPGSPSPLPEALRDRVLELTLTQSPTPRWKPRSAMWLVCTCIHRRRRSWSAWTRSRRSTRGSGPPRPFPSDPDARRRPASTTSGTAPPRCSPPSRWHRPGHRRLHRAPSPPGVSRLPPAGRRRLSAPAAARGGRQLRHAQAPGGARLAGPPPADHPALQADLGLVAEPGRGVLLDSHPPGPAPRHLPTGADLIAAIQRFIDAWNDRCAPFIWTKDPDTIIAKATDPRHRKTQPTSDTEH
jgi:hypothetical protein